MALYKHKKKESRWLDACANAGHCASILFMVMIITMISMEIFVQAVFRFSTFISEKPLVYFFTAVVMMGVAQVLRDGSRARRMFLSSRLGARKERFFCTTVTLTAIAFCTSALYQSVIMLFNTCLMDVNADHASSACLFVPHAIIPVGFLLFDLQLIAIFFRGIRTHAHTPWQRKD